MLAPAATSVLEPRSSALLLQMIDRIALLVEIVGAVSVVFGEKNGNSGSHPNGYSRLCASRLRVATCRKKSRFG